MRKALSIIISTLFAVAIHSANAQQRNVYNIYFDKYPDEYTPSYIPQNIIPASAVKEGTKNQEKDILIGQLEYKWVETDPNGNECKIILRYERHTPATTNYGWGSVARDIKPQEVAYYTSLIYAGTNLADDCDVVEVKGIPQEHLPKIFGPSNPDAPRKIIMSLRKAKSIPQGYIIYFKSPDKYVYTTAYANISLGVSLIASIHKNPKAGFHHEFMKNRVKEIGTLAYNKLVEFKGKGK